MSSHLSRDEVARIAELARLELAPEDAALFARQLTAILEYAAQVQQVNTDGVPPTTTAGALTVWRDDTPQDPLRRDIVLDEAPEASRDAGLFRVPKVI